MKGLTRLLACSIVVLCLCLPAAAAPVSAPAEILAETLQAVKNWTPPPEKPLDWPAELDYVWHFVPLLGDALPPLLQRLEYELGGSRIVGTTAVVDLQMTAPDVRGLCREMGSEAATMLAVGKLLGAPVDLSSAFRRRLRAAAAAEELRTVSTQTSVYFVTGGDGRWKIDLSDPRNLDFFGAFLPPALT
jgi:hypothetical protein